MKEWICLKCGRKVLAFEEDMANRNERSFAETRKGEDSQCKCAFALSGHTEVTALIHGEAGFLCEGTVFDSINSIHDHESMEIQRAEDNRELKGYLEAIKNS